MNFQALRESLYREAGKQQSGQRPNYFLQQVDDCINNAIDRIKKATQWWNYDIRIGSLSIVSGTKTYDLNDFCLLPISFWTEGDEAHPITLVQVKEMDYSGLRSTEVLEAENGPYRYSWYPRRHTTSKQGVCNITEDDATVAATSWSVGSSFATTDVGKRIRFQGREIDFEILSRTDANTIELNRNWRGLLTGTGTSGTSGNLSSGKFEISPPGIWQVEFNPEPSEAQTVYYRYVRMWTKLLHNDETPALPEDYHYIIPYGARAELLRYLKDFEAADRAEATFQGSIKKMQEQDKPAGDPGRVFYYSGIRSGHGHRARSWPPDRDMGRR